MKFSKQICLSAISLTALLFASSSSASDAEWFRVQNSKTWRGVRTSKTLSSVDVARFADPEPDPPRKTVEPIRMAEFRAYVVKRSVIKKDGHYERTTEILCDQTSQAPVFDWRTPPDVPVQFLMYPVKCPTTLEGIGEVVVNVDVSLWLDRWDFFNDGKMEETKSAFTAFMVYPKSEEGGHINISRARHLFDFSISPDLAFVRTMALLEESFVVSKDGTSADAFEVRVETKDPVQ